MTPLAMALILAGVVLNAGAQLLLKAGTRPLGPISMDLASAFPTALKVMSQGPIVAGLACYVVSVIVWIAALSRVDVSLAYPMLSLGYVVNALAAWWLFGEAIGPMRCAALLVILVGVAMLSLS